ncbi:MAG: RES domain-containing protein [Acetobacteraceae bacterium]|nr:RES domain-containing protein [Acetobacteraceae bacterium]
MIPRAAPWQGGTLRAWRLDRARHAAAWDSGEGAFRVGGRWNGKGVRAVYCALDAATAILEVAVHKGFRVLDTDPHVLTALALPDATPILVVAPQDVPNPNWLVPGIPSAGQQEFGNALLAVHGMIAVPSVVSRHSWNLVFDAARAAGRYALAAQERFALDPRLHPAER